MNKKCILISSCLCGNNVRYDGHIISEPLIKKLEEKYQLIKVCPEVLGGFELRRLPSEVKNGAVYNEEGENVSRFFRYGARRALEIAKKYECVFAILKDKSPSCGSKRIYDGTFTNTTIIGKGITTIVLEENNIPVYSENDIEEILAKEKDD